MRNDYTGITGITVNQASNSDAPTSVVYNVNPSTSTAAARSCFFSSDLSTECIY